MEKKELQYIHSFEEYVNEFINALIAYSPKLISAIFILIIGLYGVGCILYLLGTGVGVWGLNKTKK